MFIVLLVVGDAQAPATPVGAAGAVVAFDSAALPVWRGIAQFNVAPASTKVAFNKRLISDSVAKIATTSRLTYALKVTTGNRRIR
jgi:hypothetical protein